jgi:hypothetical protein
MIKSLKNIFFYASLLLVVNIQNVIAEDLATLMKRVQDYASQENYSKAIEELSWVQKELEKMNMKKLEAFLPNDLSGFKGGKVEQNSALGMTNMERTYTKGSETVTVSVTGGGAGSPLGGLAGLGRMAMAFGGQPGMDSFRISGRTANLNEQGDSSDLTIFLDSGSMLNIKGANGDTLKKLAEAMPIDAMDKYLKGN